MSIADERDTEVIQAELRDALSNFFGDAWERLGDVSGRRWIHLVGALVFGIVLSGGFESWRRWRSRR
jgi:hypothetical protein